MRILFLMCAILTAAFAARPFPPHVTLVRPLGKAPRPTAADNRPAAQPSTCGHIQIVPADSAIDPGIIYRDPVPTMSRMPIMAGVPPCSPPEPNTR